MEAQCAVLLHGHPHAFLGIVAFSAVGQVSRLYDELVSLRVAATVRAANAEANTDYLTGLVNRNGLQSLHGSSVELAIAFFLDLDRFKLINDTYGHAAGDQVLRVVSDRIRSCMRAADVVARLDGDEFVVVISEPPNVEIGHLAEKLLASLGQPIFINGDHVTTYSLVRTSISTNCWPGATGRCMKPRTAVGQSSSSAPFTSSEFCRRPGRRHARRASPPITARSSRRRR